MSKYLNRENTIINHILVTLHNDGNYGMGYLERILVAGGYENMGEAECRAILNKLRLYGLIEMTLYTNAEAVPFYYRHHTIQLSEKSKKLIEEHGTYFKYLKHQKSSKFQKRIDLLLKNTTGIIAIVSTVTTCILAILSGIDIRDRATLKEELRQASKATDSLIRVVNSQQKQLDTIQAKYSRKP